MKFATYPILVAGALALAAGQALPERGREAVSGSRAFSIDGRRFLVEDTGAGTDSLVERELARRGIDAQRHYEHIVSVLDSRNIQPLREMPPATPASPLPAGLVPDHVMRLETATGPVEIAFGQVDREDKNILGRLRRRGWNCTETDSRIGLGAIAQLTERKETSFVLFDKSEGRFLAIRRAVR